MSRRRLYPGMAIAALAAVVALAGCGHDKIEFPARCNSSATAFRIALNDVPLKVALADGTLISECVRKARNDSELQTLGFTLTQVADELEPKAERDPLAARRLGFLIGAVRRGAERSEGIGLELARRLEHTGPSDASPAVRAALQGGVRAGETDG